VRIVKVNLGFRGNLPCKKLEDLAARQKLGISDHHSTLGAVANCPRRNKIALSTLRPPIKTMVCLVLFGGGPSDCGAAQPSTTLTISIVPLFAGADRDFRAAYIR